MGNPTQPSETLSWQTGLETLAPVPLGSIPLNRPLSYPLYIRIGEHFILFRPKDDVLSNQRFETLKENIDTIFIPKSSLLVHQLALEQQLAEGIFPTAEERLLNLRHLLVSYQQSLERKSAVLNEQLKKFEQLGGQLAAGIRDNPTLGQTLLKRYRDPGLYFVNHSINVAVYGAAVAYKLNLHLKDVQVLTYACLIHNVGNLLLPRDLLYRNGTLTKKEWEAVESHPEKGAELLAKLYAPKEVILTTLQHHERIDGSGYPRKLRGDDIHLFAKICTIADVYDALTNHAPYQEAMVPMTAIYKMRHMLGKFEPRILNMVAAT